MNGVGFQFLSGLERDALQEIMSIGFSKAVVDLAEAINLRVQWSAPDIDVPEAEEVLRVINNQALEGAGMTMITLLFSGKFSGTGFLLIPQDNGSSLSRLLDPDVDSHAGTKCLDVLMRESLLEVGNIMLSSCVENIAELLGDDVIFSPPRYYSPGLIHSALNDIVESKVSSAVLFKTVFSFEQDTIKGGLFLVSSVDVLKWLKPAIGRYLGRYDAKEKQSGRCLS